MGSLLLLVRDHLEAFLDHACRSRAVVSLATSSATILTCGALSLTASCSCRQHEDTEEDRQEEVAARRSSTHWRTSRISCRRPSRAGRGSRRAGRAPRAPRAAATDRTGRHMHHPLPDMQIGATSSSLDRRGVVRASSSSTSSSPTWRKTGGKWPDQP